MRWVLCIFQLACCFILAAQPSPNILWIVCEDISPTLSMYGDSTAQTPVLDKLAKEALVYENAFAVVGVCAPSRSAIITGNYPTSIGTMHMRTGKDVFSWGKRKYATPIPIRDINGDSIGEYAVVLPPDVKCFPEYLRAAGYYCTNNSKTDYQFAAPLTAWDENDNQAHWRNRPAGQPFFSVFNINITHESQLWKNADRPLTVAPESVLVPPYLPDEAMTRQDIARHYSNVELMDAQVGKILDELKADGLYDQTIVFFYSDHGGPLPRQKREIYDSGLKVPFMVKMLPGQISGRTDRLISFVDLAPTVLSLAGISTPKSMEGQAFLGAQATEARKYIYASSDRFDEYTDRIRVIRDRQMLYVRNFFPELPKYKDLAYRKNIPSMEQFLRWKAEGKLNAIQQSWFEGKSKEELYDCSRDPYQLENLAQHPDYQADLEKMRTLLWEQLGKSPDWGQIPEAGLIELMWPDGQQGITATPDLAITEGQIQISYSTPGSSLAYRWSDQADEALDYNLDWQLYTTAIPIRSGQYLYFLAERIGYQPSPMQVQYFGKSAEE